MNHVIELLALLGILAWAFGAMFWSSYLFSTH